MLDTNTAALNAMQSFKILEQEVYTDLQTRADIPLDFKAKVWAMIEASLKAHEAMFAIVKKLEDLHD
jgi:phosphopantetheinyl transferase (holo-ACP synthase)